jgi:hypothetical protein
MLDLLLGPSIFPISLKLAYTLFVCILIPVYWHHHGPANFLWFSDIALFGSLIALWIESPLVASTQAVSVVLLEMVWTFDFLARLMFRLDIAAISKYMFDERIPLFVRGLSLFHLWLPPLLLWLVYRLGYDPRAWLAQSVLTCLVLVICYYVTDPSKNVNWTFGLWGKRQTRLRPGLYLLLLSMFFSLGIYLPSHLLLRALMPAAS